MLTPIEIRQQTFNKEFRGYNRVEVDAFLQEVAKMMEQQMEVSRNLKEELEKIKASYETLKEVENMLHKTLMQAEQSSRSTVENARQKADLKIQEAEAKAREIVQRGINERSRIDSEILELNKWRGELLGELQNFLHSQLGRLETFGNRELVSAARERMGSLNGKINGKEGLFESNGRSNGNGSHDFFEDLADSL